MPVDVNSDSIRIRQRDPGDFDEKSFRTISITTGIQAVVGHLKGDSSMTVQTFIFDKEKYTKAEAEAWVLEHKAKKASELDARRAFQFVSMAPLLAEDRALARGEILRAGSWVYGGQEMQVTEEMLSQALENWKAHKRDVMLDYDHGSRVGKTPEERKRAGDLVGLELGKAGETAALYGMFKPTDDAADYLEKGEYKYLSAEFDEDYFHPEDKDWIGMYLLAVALTNRPFIEGMAPITLMSEEAGKALAEYGKGGTLTVYVKDAGMLDDVRRACEEKGAQVVGWYQDVKMYAEKKAGGAKTAPDAPEVVGFALCEVERPSADTKGKGQ